MAELSTIARPYAQGLMKALKDRNAGAEDVAQDLEVIEALASLTKNPEVATLVGDPKLTDDQLCDLIAELCGNNLPKEVANMLRVVIENGRLEALPEIAAQYRALKNESEGVADAYIETAFPLDDKGVKQVIADLSDRFPGLKLNPIVTVNPALIGGVSVTVGDQIIDISVRTRLKKMQAALTA